MRIVGNPGGLFHLRDGAVIAVDSPGAPGAETLLMRSGRISEEDWNAAMRAMARSGSTQSVLGTIGSAELRILVMAVTQDGTFATAAGVIEQYDIDAPVDVLLSIPGGVGLDILLRETARRLDAIACLSFPVSPFRERVKPARGTNPQGLTTGQLEILANATGRRTARDIAFAIGRGVYPVTTEISRMLDDGLLEISTESFRFSHWGVTSLRSRAEIAQSETRKETY